MVRFSCGVLLLKHFHFTVLPSALLSHFPQPISSLQELEMSTVEGDPMCTLPEQSPELWASFLPTYLWQSLGVHSGIVLEWFEKVSAQPLCNRGESFLFVLDQVIKQFHNLLNPFPLNDHIVVYTWAPCRSLDVIRSGSGARLQWCCWNLRWCPAGGNSWDTHI